LVKQALSVHVERTTCPFLARHVLHPSFHSVQSRGILTCFGSAVVVRAGCLVWCECVVAVPGRVLCVCGCVDRASPCLQ